MKTAPILAAALLASTISALAGDEIQLTPDALRAAIAAQAEARKQEAAQATSSKQTAPESRPQWSRMSSLQGASLQPASGLQKSTGLQPSGPYRGAAEAVSSPMSETEWRRLFPKKDAR